MFHKIVSNFKKFILFYFFFKFSIVHCLKRVELLILFKLIVNCYTNLSLNSLRMKIFLYFLNCMSLFYLSATAKHITVSEDIKIENDFLLCKKLEKSVVIADDCKSDTKCIEFNNQMRNLEKQEDLFTILSEEKVVYSASGVVSIASCEKVSSISISDAEFNMDKCVDLLPVETSHGYSFLRNDGFLTKEYTGTVCPAPEKRFFVNDVEFV